MLYLRSLENIPRAQHRFFNVNIIDNLRHVPYKTIRGSYKLGNSSKQVHSYSEEKKTFNSVEMA